MRISVHADDTPTAAITRGTMSQMIVVIDYGMGNLRSVTNAFASLGITAFPSADPAALRDAAAIVLPGVGAFSDGMENLRARGWIPVLQDEVISRQKPFLGLCLGMELLASQSTEHGTHHGLGWIPGTVDRLPTGDPPIKVPHIGWNDVRIVRSDGLYAGLRDSETFYFVHSYIFTPDDPGVVSAVCRYGTEWAASVEAGNIVATQFHPEKSQRAGLALLRNFVRQLD